MNKKYFLYMLLAGFLSLPNHSYAGPRDPMDLLGAYIITAASVSLFTYAQGRWDATLNRDKFPDAPPHFQQWARRILAESGLSDAETVPLKMGVRWQCHGDVFIECDSKDTKVIDDIIAGRDVKHTKDDQQQVLAVSEWTLLHEKKHYHNGDGDRRALLDGLVSAPIALMPSIMASEFSFALMGVGLVLNAAVGRHLTTYLISHPCHKYQEYEADRYASMHISPEKLPMVQRWFEHIADNIEKSLLVNKIEHANLFGKGAWFVLSEELHKTNKEIAENEGDLAELRKKRAKIIEQAHAVWGPEHPSCPDRAKFVRECFEKRMKAAQQGQGARVA